MDPKEAINSIESRPLTEGEAISIKQIMERERYKVRINKIQNSPVISIYARHELGKFRDIQKAMIEQWLQQKHMKYDEWSWDGRVLRVKKGRGIHEYKAKKLKKKIDGFMTDDDIIAIANLPVPKVLVEPDEKPQSFCPECNEPMELADPDVEGGSIDWICKKCGVHFPAKYPCEQCGGTGEVHWDDRDRDFKEPCGKCDGSGYVDE